MAGTMTHVVYNTDVGGAFRIRIPAWVATLTGATAASTQPTKPTGLRPRRRFFLNTATQREGSFVVPDLTSAMYTDAPGTAITVESGVFGGTGQAATLQGRRGERDKNI